jgi:hypothetical protein
MKKGIYIIWTLVFSACSIITGVKQPEMIDTKTYHEKKQQWNIAEENCMVLKTNWIDTLRAKKYKPNFSPGFRPLQFQCYDKEGKLISQYSSCEGSLEKLELFDSYPPKNYHPFDTLFLVKEKEKYLADDLKTNPNFNTDYDLLILVYWSSWMGKPSRKLVEKILNYRTTHAKHNIQLYFVNIAEYAP